MKILDMLARATWYRQTTSRTIPRAAREIIGPAMATIRVTHRTGAIYDVIVDDGRGTTAHEVAVWPSPDATPEELLDASFRFLLEREPKEAILDRFELPIIERYFPDYPARVAGMIGTE
jgi:hypothetical protein